MKFTVNQKDLRNLQLEINKAIDESTEDGYDFFKQTTPIRGGNARRNTRYQESSTRAVINANYDYATRLDNGYSKQAPKGMSKPTIDFLRRTIRKRFRRI